MTFVGVITYIKEINQAFWRWNLEHGRGVLDPAHAFFNTIFHVLVYTALALTIFYFILSIIILLNKKTKEKDFDIKNAPFVTIQIPTRNEIIALRCAEMCLDFDYPKNKYNILIGDDSNDKTVSKKLEEFAALHEKVTIIHRKENTGFKPGNLNNMLKHSSGEIILIFDSDFTPEKDFLKRIVAPLVNDKTVSAVQAKWNYNNFSQNFVTILASTIGYICHNLALTFMRKFESGFLCGSAEAVRKKDLLNMGKWKSGSMTEDIEFSLRLYKENKKIVYIPTLECYGDVPFKPKDLYKQQMRWAYGVISAYKEHFKGIFFNKILTKRKKVLGSFAAFGYLLPVLIILLFLFGLLSFITDTPAPLNLAKFFSETGKNILLTSGLIFASIISLYKARKIKYSFKMIASSFTVGLMTTFYVNKGIIKAILKKPMEWYLLSKNINYSVKH